MNIGFIVGKDDEMYDDDYLYSITPKKYLQYDNLEICLEYQISNKLSNKRRIISILYQIKFFYKFYL